MPVIQSIERGPGDRNQSSVFSAFHTHFLFPLYIYEFNITL